jgi:hypothetical protein
MIEQEKSYLNIFTQIEATKIVLKPKSSSLFVSLNSKRSKPQLA